MDILSRRNYTCKDIWYKSFWVSNKTCASFVLFADFHPFSSFNVFFINEIVTNLFASISRFRSMPAAKESGWFVNSRFFQSTISDFQWSNIGIMIIWDAPPLPVTVSTLHFFCRNSLLIFYLGQLLKGRNISSNYLLNRRVFFWDLSLCFVNFSSSSRFCFIYFIFCARGRCTIFLREVIRLQVLYTITYNII